MKKTIYIILLLLISAMLVGTISASATSVDYITVDGYHSDTDYFKEMVSCAIDGSKYALQAGVVYEMQRNLKIDVLKLDHAKTHYFTIYSTGAEILTAMRIDKLKSEHLVAGQVYEYLCEKGYSDPVIAGILGNMMAECGGQTLDLQWWIYGGGGAYYGLCQWSLYFGPDVKGLDVNSQLDYLMSNIEKNMEYFGGDYDYFCNIQDAGTAARYFANYYERGSGVSTRIRNAYIAMAWITE